MNKKGQVNPVMVGKDANASLTIRFIGFLLVLAVLSFIVTLGSWIFMGLLILIGIGISVYGGWFARTHRFRWLILAGGILLIILSIASIFVLTPVLSLVNFIGDVLRQGVIFPLFLLICGLLMIILGTWLFKSLGVILILISTADNVSSIAKVFSSFGLSSTIGPNYFLFTIALLAGIVMLLKIPGVLPKITGVVLPFATFPPINQIIIDNISNLIPALSGELFLGLTAGMILVFIFMIISAIYLFTKLGTFEPKWRGISILLGILLIGLAIPYLVDSLAEVISQNITQPLANFLDSTIAGYFGEKSFSSSMILTLIIGLICLLFGKRPFQRFVGAYGAGRGLFNRFRRQPQIPPAGAPGYLGP